MSEAALAGADKTQANEQSPGREEFPPGDARDRVGGGQSLAKQKAVGQLQGGLGLGAHAIAFEADPC